VLRFDLDGPALANTRFAISPVAAAVHALSLMSPGAAPFGGGWQARMRAAVRDHRLVAIGALFGAAGDYVPDFLTPQPLGPEADLGDELHAIATTGSERLAFELRVTAAGVPSENIAGIDGGRAPTALRDLAQRGERATAERLAAEIEQVWRLAVAPAWPVLRARMEADILAQAQVMARHGLAALWPGLHPSLDMPAGDHLRIDSRFHGRIPSAGGLTLMPTVFGSVLRIIADSKSAPDPRPPMLAYPLAPDARNRSADAAQRESGPGAGRSGGTQPDSAAPDLLGATRARLLADLDIPRTTVELGERHYLAVSTVSYHLGILHRSGLVTRVRDRNRVLYQHSSRAAAVLPGSGR
jgi:DNA-binding transcriptional ArsR family regulator